MKNYRIITMNDKNTGDILYYWLLFKKDKIWYGLADDEGIKQFKTKLEAKEYGETL
jgi:hypothetical protein